MNRTQHADNNQKLPALLTTAELAAYERISPFTIRKNYCMQGQHHGMVPIKLRSGNLRWPSAGLIAMLNDGASNV
ncbi:hypothetical protein [Undibacterium sp. Ren11W]|uniref:hypothetical protein n=1 Tax=Undibacterium sp. Ren11W TaxID=3413045 RepID=UPI003BEFA8EF